MTNRRQNIFDERESWQGPIAFSTTLHAAFFALIFLYSAYLGRLPHESWGSAAASAGDALSVSLVSQAALPLPRPAIQTQNIVANDSPGLTQSKPRELPVPEAQAIPIPAREHTRKLPSPVKEKPAVAARAPIRDTYHAEPPREANVVPFGRGGPVATPYKVFSLGGSSAGIGTPSDSGFGSRYGWYVDVVRRKVSENWLRYEIDPAIQNARRVFITFDIPRNGQPENVQIEQSSGVPSLDISAVRALQRIDTFGPLPPDYSGRQVSVEFWFEFKR